MWQNNEQICGKIMSKFVAKFGGYCRKLGKNMVDIDGNLADIWRIYLKEFTAKYGGYCRKLENKMVVIPENI